MLREDAIDLLDNLIGMIEDNHNSDYDKALKMAIKSLEQEQEPCEDCISRQAVINGIDNYIEKVQSTGAKDDFISFEELVVKALPPIKPKQKVGNWKRISMDKYSEHAKYWYRCDRCGRDNLGNTNYCPNCGCAMKGELK